MSKTILITGGTGLVGTHLTHLLQQKGYAVKYLSRSAGTKNGVTAHAWDIKRQTIDPHALEGVTAIIHLAGAGVSDGRWTARRKKEIMDSRILSTALLHQTLLDTPHQVSTFISASGTGCYGRDTGAVWMEETEPCGHDFLAEVTRQWEASADRIATLPIRVAKLRTGMVLSKQGGALPKLALPVRWGAGAAVGSGKQYISWIHLHDLCRLYIHVLEDALLSGTYNAAAPQPVTNDDFMKTLANTLHKPYFLPRVPGILLKIMLGEMASVVLGGNRVSAEKVRATGFCFQYDTLDKALADLL